MENPVLVEVLRGDRVESRHAGAVAVLDPEGGVVFAAGDIDQAVYPRSAVKAIQALPLIESGAADRFGLTEAELALACASHGGEPAHVETARSMLAKAGQSEGCLECGVQWPSETRASRTLAASGQEAGAIHNNCSGKHSGFICVACAMGEAPSGYIRPEHPAMREVTAALSAVTETRLDEGNRATDGCSIPTYAIPLRALAQAFARYGSGKHLAPERAKAAARLRRAVAAHPFMVAGTGRFDTEVMEAFGERLFTKTGAEGVFCAAIPEAGLGIAIKCDDGAGRAAQAATAAVLRRFLPEPGDKLAVLDKLAGPVLHNWNRIEIGRLRPAGPLASR
jgi:L-asparaginase II